MRRSAATGSPAWCQQPDPGGVWLFQYGVYNYIHMQPADQAGDCGGDASRDQGDRGRRHQQRQLRAPDRDRRRRGGRARSWPAAMLMRRRRTVGGPRVTRRERRRGRPGRRGRRGRPGQPATAPRLREVRRRQAARRAREPDVHAGRELLPLPGAARRPGPHAGPRPAEHARSSSPSSTRPTAWTSRWAAVPHVPEEPAHGDLGLLDPLPPRRLRHPDSSGCGRRCCWSAPPRCSPRSSASGSGSAAAGTAAGRSTEVATGASLTLYSMPEWWLGLLLIAALAVGIGPLPGALPDRRAALGRRRSGVALGRARHRLAPGAAGDHPDPGLPGRLRADHARVAASTSSARTT